jgi:hypothetical protein
MGLYQRKVLVPIVPEVPMVANIFNSLSAFNSNPRGLTPRTYTVHGLSKGMKNPV